MDYSSYFEIHDRLSSQKQIALVNYKKFGSFIHAIVYDPDIEDHFKALVLISISGGLRVSEALSLTKDHFIEQPNGHIRLRFQVLKKKKKEMRDVMIHPLAEAFIKNYIKDKVGKVIKMSQPTAFRKMHKYFRVDGICNHTLRHSAISMLLFERKMPIEKVASLLHIGIKTIEHYSHLNEMGTYLDEVYSDVA